MWTPSSFAQPKACGSGWRLTRPRGKTHRSKTLRRMYSCKESKRSVDRFIFFSFLAGKIVCFAHIVSDGFQTHDVFNVMKRTTNPDPTHGCNAAEAATSN